MQSRTVFLIAIAIAGAIWWILRDPADVSMPAESSEVHNEKPKRAVKAMPVVAPPPLVASTPALEIKKTVPVKVASVQKEKTPKGSLPYSMDDGLIVVASDIIIGEPVSPNAPEFGYVEMPKIQLWPRVIPYHIQPHLSNPDRVLEALKKFEDTSLQFVPYTNENDVIVFDERPGHCKSYLGRIGGKQPIWLSPNCDAGDIAHEIMHALGFIHEQNRTDRDQFVKVLWENVQEEQKINFELFPRELMVLTGGSPFDFNSIMIYDPSSFAKSPGMTTLQSLQPGHEIRAGSSLSPSDLNRIERVYGR